MCTLFVTKKALMSKFKIKYNSKYVWQIKYMFPRFYEQKKSCIGKNWFVKHTYILSNFKKSYDKLNF